MKTAIFGGSFDPVHWGHIRLAESCINQTDFERILFVPSYISAHKKNKNPVSGEHRIEMLRRATVSFDWSLISDCEIKRKGISWTIDTIRYLKAEGLVDDKPGLIIGDDLLENFSLWREYETILDEVRLIVGRRFFTEKQHFEWPCEYLDNPVWTFSSTQLKLDLKSGGGVDLVPPEVYSYIKENGLYLEEND